MTSPGVRSKKLLSLLVERVRGSDPAARPGEPGEIAELDVDEWLVNFFDEELAPIEAACANPGTDPFAVFGDLDDDLWALLLTRNFSSYPNIRAILPSMPEPQLQMNWNGAHGIDLLRQSKAFYGHVKGMGSANAKTPLRESRVLDFGIGWGRLARFFARDVRPGNLMGVDPTEGILEVCRQSRVPAELERTDFVPASLPFHDIDLAYSFSVFTHISEAASEACLDALHASMTPGGLLVVTIRPPGYLDISPWMDSGAIERGRRPGDPQEPRYVFVPHPIVEGHPQYDGGEMTYGETVINLPWLRERWGDRFELIDVSAAVEDIYQVAVTLRRV